MRIRPVANRQPMVPRRAPELPRLMLLICLALAVTAALLPALLLLLVGFPLVPSLAGGALGYMLVDATTNLVTLSSVTRSRLIAISYAMQVAQAHNGWLEIKLWPNDDFAARLQLPQVDEGTEVH